MVNMVVAMMCSVRSILVTGTFASIHPSIHPSIIIIITIFSHGHNQHHGLTIILVIITVSICITTITTSITIIISIITIIRNISISVSIQEYPREREKVVPLLVLEHQQQSNPRSTVTQVKSYRQERVAKILRERSIFSNTSQDYLAEFVAEILNFGTVRVFMPGDRIIQQGAEGNSMFILSVGMAEVVKESLEENLHFIGGLTYGSVFGELVMLGVQSKRTASIIASSTCCTWEVASVAERSTLLEL
eukprot:s31_g14.t1